VTKILLLTLTETRNMVAVPAPRTTDPNYVLQSHTKHPISTMYPTITHSSKLPHAHTHTYIHTHTYTHLLCHWTSSSCQIHARTSSTAHLLCADV